jgi:hypothetical protein
MMAIALVGASRMPAAEAWSPWHVGIAFLGLCLIVAAGYVDPDFTFIGGLVIVIILIALVIACPRVTLAALISITAFLGGSQLLQNSREPLGQFKLSPYYWAFRDNPVEEKVRVAVNAQTWVLANTTSDDQIMQWVEGPWIMGDRELYTVAAMQLWGPNLLTLEPVLDKVYGLPNLERFRPSVIEMSGKSMNSVMTFWKSLPSKLNATPPKCYDYAWPIDPRSDYPTPIGHTCLTRLTW